MTADVDKIKIALAFVCIVAGVWGYYYFSDTALVLRVLMVLGGLVAAGVRRLAVGAGQAILRLRAGILGRKRSASSGRRARKRCRPRRSCSRSWS